MQFFYIFSITKACPAIKQAQLDTIPQEIVFELLVMPSNHKKNEKWKSRIFCLHWSHFLLIKFLSQNAVHPQIRNVVCHPFAVILPIDMFIGKRTKKEQKLPTLKPYNFLRLKFEQDLLLKNSNQKIFQKMVQPLQGSFAWRFFGLRTPKNISGSTQKKFKFFSGCGGL